MALKGENWTIGRGRGEGSRPTAESLKVKSREGKRTDSSYRGPAGPSNDLGNGAQSVDLLEDPAAAANSANRSSQAGKSFMSRLWTLSSSTFLALSSSLCSRS